MALEIIRIDTAGMTPEQLYNAMDQKLANLVQQLNMKLLFFNDQDTNIIETRKTILTIEQAQSEFEQVITNNIAAIDGNIYKIHGELADYKKVVAGELTAVDGYIATLRGEFADYKVIVADNFTATNGTIITLTGELADYKKVVAGELEAASGNITVLTGELADYKKIVAGELEATNGKILTLSGDLANYKTIIAGDLSAINGNIQNLVSNIGSISTLLFGSATGTTITTEFSNSVVSHIGTAQIHSGMIKDLAFDKITGFDVNTTNLMIHSEDGKSQWKDNTIQISDANRVRVQIGKDAGGDYSMYVWDAAGKLMFDALGLTGSGIQREIIRNDMVAANANISGEKLNIVSVFKEMNGSTETLKSNRIYLNEKEQTLDVAFLAMSEKVTEQGSTLTSYGTELTTIQGQISSKVWKQDITTAVDAAQTAMNTQYSNLEQSLNGFKISVGETYSTKTEASKVLEAANQAILASQANAEDLTSFIKSTNSGFEDLQGQIDGSIMTWFYSYVPTNLNIPAKDWTTTDLKNNHLGDLFYDTVTGYCYRWQVLNNTYSWQRITDVDVTKALSDAAKAQDTADSKRRVFTTTPIPPYEVGDLWTQGAGGELMSCKIAKTESQSYNAVDWEKAAKYTDDTKAKEAIKQIETTNSRIAEVVTDLSGITSRVGETETSVTAINGDVTNLTNRVKEAELQITKDAIVSKVSDIYTTKADFNALEVGGRNYFSIRRMTAFNENNEIVLKDYQNTGSFTQFYNLTVPMKDFIGKKVTLSFDCISPNGSTGISVYNNNSNPRYQIAVTGIKTPINNWWTHQELAITVADKGDTFLEEPSNKIEIYCPAKMGVKVKNVKLEIGNKATDWTPAPEDIDESIGIVRDDVADAKTAVEDVESTITQLSDSISQLVVGKDGQTLMKQTENGWVFDMKDILSDLDKAAENIGDLNDNLGTVQDNVGTLKETVTPLSDMGSYVTIGKDPKQPYIELGKKGSEGSEFKVRITNTDIQFMEGNDVPAYINNQKLNIKKAIVKEELQFGGFVWTERANGNMGLLWKGEN